MGSYVRSSDMLKDIDRDVREIRFRVAAVSLDQMPATGSANHLKEAREKIAANWKRYRYRVYEKVIPLRNMVWGGDFN